MYTTHGWVLQHGPENDLRNGKTCSRLAPDTSSSVVFILTARGISFRTFARCASSLFSSSSLCSITRMCLLEWWDTTLDSKQEKFGEYYRIPFSFAISVRY